VLDEAARYFSDSFGGRMVRLTGLVTVAGATPRDLFSPAQHDAEGFSVHADADEHSRLLFLHPELVSREIKTAPPVVGRNFADLVPLARRDDWRGYFGTPAIATAAAGARAMNAMAQAAIDAALNILDGAPDSDLPRVAGMLDKDRDVQSVLEASLERERRIEQRQNEWLARTRR